MQLANLFPYKIKNRPLFYDRNHDNVHLLDRDAYWDSQLRRAIEGWWVNDNGTWVFVPPQLFHFINIFITTVTTEYGGRKPLNPELTDREMIYAHYYLCCGGFSGFVDDETYTCDLLVEMVENGAVLDVKEQKRLAAHKHSHRKDGTLKKYVWAWEYLRTGYLLDHPQGKPLGNPVYDNDMQDVFIFGARNSIKTTWACNVISHSLFTGGVRSWDNVEDVGTNEQLFGIGSVDSPKVNAVADIIQQFYKNFPGSYSKDGMFLFSPLHRNLVGTWESGGEVVHEYMNLSPRMKKGSGSKLSFGVYTKQNRKLFVGGRRSWILYDEIGLEDDIITIINAEKETLRDKTSGRKIGIGIRQGTSGFISNLENTKKVFYHPKVYGCYAIPNYWQEPDKMIGLFMPDYYVNREYKDENGNTYIEDAYKASVKHVNDLIENGAEAKDILEFEQNNPNWPDQMFVDVGGSVLPMELAKIRRMRIIQDGAWREIGDLSRDTNGKVRLILNPRGTVIDAYTSKTKKVTKDNSWVIFERPLVGAQRGLYKVVYDPIRSDGLGVSNDASLVAIIVHKGFDLSAKGKQNNIVARWCGRLNTKDLNHEQAILIAEYYNATVLHEEDLGDFASYCKNAKKSNYMAPTPQSTSKLKISGNAVYNVGIKVGDNPDFKAYALELYSDWLKREVGGTDEETDRLNMNIDELDDLLILDEVANFGAGNYDCTSAMLILMVWLRSEVETKYESGDAGSKKDNKSRELYEFAIRNLGYKPKALSHAR